MRPRAASHEHRTHRPLDRARVVRCRRCTQSGGSDVRQGQARMTPRCPSTTSGDRTGIQAKHLILRSQLVKFLTYLSLSRQRVRYLPTKYQRDKSSGFEWLAMGASVYRLCDVEHPASAATWVSTCTASRRFERVSSHSRGQWLNASSFFVHNIAAPTIAST